MRALPPLRALALPALALLLSGACSLLAPSDAELRGGATQPAESTAGSGGASEPLGGGAGEGNAELPPPGGQAGQTGASGAGGEGEGGGGELSSLIPQEGLALWLMADRGIGDAGDGRVAVWADFSPNLADAKQASATLQPRLVPGEGKGPPLVEFDGDNDQLALPAGFADFSAGLTVFIIASQSSEQECPSLLHLSNNPEEQDVEVGRFRGAVHYEVENNAVWGPDNTFGLQQLVLVAVTHAPGQSPVLQLNGVFMSVGDFTALPVAKERANNFIGRSLYGGCETLHGRIGEVILYERALETEERLSVQRYLQSKWSYEPPVPTKPGPGEIPAGF